MTTRKIKEPNIVQGKGLRNPFFSFEIKAASCTNYQLLLGNAGGGIKVGAPLLAIL